MNKKIFFLILSICIVSSGLGYIYINNAEKSFNLQDIKSQTFSTSNYLSHDSDYIECLVKTSDNILSKESRDKWTQEMFEEERRANSKQGYVILCKESPAEWGKEELNPAKYILMKIPANEYNESWLEPEYDYDNPICYDASWGEIPCTEEVADDFKEYPIITKRAYRIPLESILTQKEIDDIKSIRYNEKVNWSISKNVTNIRSVIEENDYKSLNLSGTILHGSSGTFNVAANNAECPGATCDYTSLITWEDSEDADIRGTGPSIAVCYGAGITEGTLTIDGWTTDADDYIEITVAEGSRHNGTVGSGFIYTMNVNSNYKMILQEDYNNISWLEINGDSPDEYGNRGGIYGSGTSVTNIYNNLIYDYDVRPAIVTQYSSGVLNMWNNIILNSSNTGGGTSAVKADDTDTTINAYNNVVVATTYGFDAEDYTILIKNNICINNDGTDCYFDVNYDASSDYNTASDSSTFGAHSKNNTVPTFVNPAYNSVGSDYHLDSSDTVAKDSGVDLSSSFDYDIDGETRTGTWDIGADEYISGSDTTSPTYASISTNSTIAGQSTNFSILWNDETALNSNGQYIFSTNNSGVWANDSAVNFTATPSFANVIKTLNSTVGISIGYRWYATDNAGNLNDTGIQVLTTASSSSCSYSSGDWIVDCSDNCAISSPIDVGGNDIYITGTGTFYTSADITNYGLLHIEGTDSSNKCIVTCDGGCFKT